MEVCSQISSLWFLRDSTNYFFDNITKDCDTITKDCDTITKDCDNVQELCEHPTKSPMTVDLYEGKVRLILSL